MLMKRLAALALLLTMTAAVVGFAGLAIFLALLPGVGAALAAALTAGIFATLLAIAALLHRRNAVPVVSPMVMLKSANPASEALVTSLATIAGTYPLIAVVCASAMGLADALASQSQHSTVRTGTRSPHRRSNFTADRNKKTGERQ